MGAPHYGDFKASSTVYMVFDSFAASTGAPSAVTNFANTDIQIYKDGGTTQRSSANGITVTTSFDTQTGLQMVSIDLSDNTDAGFYATGHEYQVAVADITVDSQTLRFWLGSFSIERANGVLAQIVSGAAKVDVNTIKTQSVTLAGGITFPAATVASTTNITSATGIDVTKWNGTNVSAPATAGIPEVNVKNINNVSAAAVTTVKAVQGLTTADQITTVSGNVNGSVASVTARVTANTDQLATQTVTAAAGVTFPSSVASPTNITAGTITTVTNLTNAPTAGDLTATMKTSVQTASQAALDTTVPDSVPADGSRPSIVQAAYMLVQWMNERSVSGTTLTVKKADGSSTLMTFTLGDATSPTSITRTT